MKNNIKLSELIKLYDSPTKEHYQIYGYNIPKVEDRTGSVWIDGGTNVQGLFDAEITDRKFVENFKNNTHPNDEWTDVNIETYAKWIRMFDDKEGSRLVDLALEVGVVGYLD